MTGVQTCALPISQDLSVDGIAALLSTFSIRATITREEDRRLTELGLSSSMPAPFFEAGHALHLDPMARYRAASLFDQLERRTGNLWFGA